MQAMLECACKACTRVQQSYLDMMAHDTHHKTTILIMSTAQPSLAKTFCQQVRAHRRSETLKLPMSWLLSVPSVMAMADSPDRCIRSKHCTRSRRML